MGWRSGYWHAAWNLNGIPVKFVHHPPPQTAVPRPRSPNFPPEQSNSHARTHQSQWCFLQGPQTPSSQIAGPHAPLRVHSSSARPRARAHWTDPATAAPRLSAPPVYHPWTSSSPPPEGRKWGWRERWRWTRRNIARSPRRDPLSRANREAAHSAMGRSPSPHSSHAGGHNSTYRRGRCAQGLHMPLLCRLQLPTRSGRLLCCNIQGALHRDARLLRSPATHERHT